MTSEDVVQQLNGVVALDDFASRSGQLVDAWIAAGVGLEAVDPILRFMENNAGLDFGTPGPLVHFVERFYGMGYEGVLCESIRRKPTAHTAWMLNRLINGAKDDRQRARLVAVMQEAREHSAADKRAVESIKLFLEAL